MMMTIRTAVDVGNGQRGRERERAALLLHSTWYVEHLFFAKTKFFNRYADNEIGFTHSVPGFVEYECELASSCALLLLDSF